MVDGRNLLSINWNKYLAKTTNQAQNNNNNNNNNNNIAK